jgi:hypothetical protein
MDQKILLDIEIKGVKTGDTVQYKMRKYMQTQLYYGTRDATPYAANNFWTDWEDIHIECEK